MGGYNQMHQQNYGYNQGYQQQMQPTGGENPFAAMQQS